MEKELVMAIPPTRVYTCPVCDTVGPSLCWTDTHGVAQCFTCGNPVRTLFYDKENKRIDKAPESITRDEWVPLLRRYRDETKRIIPSGCSMPGGQELARAEDMAAFSDWCVAHKADIEAITSTPNQSEG